ncbi:hypothetical protein SUDANB99_04877 [Streptomyces sp. enrichment culture]
MSTGGAGGEVRCPPAAAGRVEREGTGPAAGPGRAAGPTTAEALRARPAGPCGTDGGPGAALAGPAVVLAGPGLVWLRLAWPWRVLAGLGARPAGSLSGWRSACRGRPVLVWPWPLQAVLAGAAGPSPGARWPFAGADRVGMALAVLAGPYGSLPGRSGPCRASVPPGLVAWWAGPGLADQGPVDLAGSRWLGGRGPRRVPVAGASGLPAGASDPSVGRSCAARPSGPGPYREAGPRLVREPWPVPDGTREAGAVRPGPPAPPGRSPRAGPRAAGRTRAGPT